MRTLIFKAICLLKMCPIFVGSVHNAGRSDNYMSISNYCISTWFDAHVDQKYWSVSSHLVTRKIQVQKNNNAPSDFIPLLLI